MSQCHLVTLPGRSLSKTRHIFVWAVSRRGGQEAAEAATAGTFAASKAAAALILWQSADDDLSVEVQGDDIVVTLAGTSYVVTYYRALRSKISRG
jgi:hypothetical protein